MRRALLAAAFALLLANCMHERSNDPEHPAVTATAQLIIHALAPNESGEDYRWEAVSNRVSGPVRWRSVDAAADAEVRRTGWLGARGAEFGLVAVGNAENVTALSIDTDTYHALALLEALRRAGAEVSFQADYETYSEYIITPPAGTRGCSRRLPLAVRWKARPRETANTQ